MNRRRVDSRHDWPPLSIRCPHCGVESPFKISHGPQNLECTGCKQQFYCLLALVRAKHSSGNRAEDTRYYSIRYFLPNDEERHIAFNTCSYDDFELRSGDEVAFIYHAHDFSDVCSIYNLTTKEDFCNEEEDEQGTSGWLDTVIGIIVIIGVLWFIFHLLPTR